MTLSQKTRLHVVRHKVSILNFHVVERPVTQLPQERLAREQRRAVSLRAARASLYIAHSHSFCVISSHRQPATDCSTDDIIIALVSLDWLTASPVRSSCSHRVVQEAAYYKDA
jgi:hypothetical protein